jgi:hypothetical protein
MNPPIVATATTAVMNAKPIPGRFLPEHERVLDEVLKYDLDIEGRNQPGEGLPASVAPSIQCPGLALRA